MKKKLLPALAAFSLSLLMACNDNVTEEEQVNNSINYGTLAQEIKKEAVSDVPKLENMLAMFKNQDNSAKEMAKALLDGFEGNLKDQNEDAKELLVELEEENEHVEVITDQKEEFEELIADEISRYDSLIKQYEDNLKNLDTTVAQSSKEKLALRLENTRQARDAMKKELETVKKSGLENFEKTAAYLQQVKKDFETDMQVRLTAMEEQINTRKNLKPDDVQKFNQQKAETARLLNESKGISIYNWENLREEIVNQVRGLELDFYEFEV